MKKLLLMVLLGVFGMVIFAQQRPTVAVAAFEVQGGVSQDEAGVVYELFIAELVSTGAVTVTDRTNLDKIITEMQFQTSDWSNKEKTARLGEVLNAGIIVRCRLMQMGDRVYWTAIMLDLKTAQVLYAARDYVNDLGKIWDKLPAFCKNLVAKVNTPNVPGIPTVAVATFDTQGGITAEEAGVVTELCITELVSTGEVNVVDRTNFDTIMKEMRFQASDWSNKEKTARLGEVLNAQNIIRGQLMKMGSTIYWTATVLDVNTAEVLSSSRLQLTNLGEVWDKLTGFRTQILAKLPPPNLFIGRWQTGGTYYDSGSKRDIYCILDIKADGTIIVIRYDSASIKTEKYFSWKSLQNDWRYVPNGVSERTGYGTGTHSTIKKDKDAIQASFSLNLSGLASGVSTRYTGNLGLNIKNPNMLSFNVNFKPVVYTGEKIGDYDVSFSYFARINSPAFPAGFTGTWKRDTFNNTLTFTENTFKDSGQDNINDLLNISGDSYTRRFRRGTNSSSTITIKLTNGNLEISGDTGTGEHNWNGIWTKQ